MSFAPLFIMDGQFTPIQQQKPAFDSAQVIQRWKSPVTPAPDQRTAGPSRMALVPSANAAGFKQMVNALADTSDPAAADSTGPSFGDFLDIINPLQHLPVINTVYRGLTGDTIGPVGQVVGGALFGGPVGAVMGTMNAVMVHQTGKDVAGTAFSLFSGKVPANLRQSTDYDPAQSIERAIRLANNAPTYQSPAVMNGFVQSAQGVVTADDQFIPSRLSVSNINKAAMPVSRYNS